MDDEERELLEGMGNCYEVCHDNFEETVWMVGRARGLSPEEVKRRLALIRKRYGRTEEFRLLRSRLPDDFPF